MGSKRKSYQQNTSGQKKKKKSYKNPHGDPWEKRLIIVKLICTNNYDATPKGVITQTSRFHWVPI